MALHLLAIAIIPVLSSYWRGWQFVQVAGCHGCGYIIDSAGRSSQMKEKKGEKTYLGT